MTVTRKLIAGLLLGVSLITVSTVLWRHYSGLIDDKAELSGRVQALEADVTREKARADAFQLSIQTWEAASARQVEALVKLTAAQREAGAYQRELKDVLSKHDLGALAQDKPKLVENRINAGTQRALRMLERATQVGATAGGPVTSGPNPAGSSSH